MKLARFDEQGTIALGAVQGDRIVVLSGQLPDGITSIIDLLAAGEQAISAAQTVADRGNGQLHCPR